MNAHATIEPEAQAGVGLQLRDYQREALAAIEEARQRGITRQLVALPTGTGKTVVFSHLIAASTRPAIGLVHRDELIAQTADKLAIVAPSLSVGVVKADRDEWDHDVVIASIQTLARPGRIARRDFGLVIVDEAHHYAAETWSGVLDELGCFDVDGPLTVGFTATPERGDGEALGEIFQAVVYRKNLLEMIQAGYLSDLRAVQVKLAADFDKLHTRAGDFIDSELEDMLLSADAPMHAAEAYQEHASGRKALLFGPTVLTAEAMTEAFRSYGIPAATISGNMPIDDRRTTLSAFRAGDIRVLSNCAVLTEGFDQPDIGAVMIARPTRSRPLYVQMVGRGTRLHPGKADCIIVDLVGATSRHDLLSLSGLTDTSPQNGESLLEALAREDSDQRQKEQAVASGKIISTEVDLFSRNRFAWMQVDGRYLLSVAEGQISLKPDGMGNFAVLFRHRDGTVKRLGDRLSLGYAQGAAEDFVRESRSVMLADRSARWRQREASDKQLAALRKMRVQIPARLTAGQASDMIARQIARYA